LIGANIDPRAEDLQALHEKLLRTYLQLGDSGNPSFRRLCYAAASDLATSFALRMESALGAETVEYIRRLLRQTDERIEQQHFGSASLKSLSGNSLNYPWRETENSERASKPARPFLRSDLSAWAWAAIGATTMGVIFGIFALAGVFQFAGGGELPDASQALYRSIHDVKPIIGKTFEAISTVENRVKTEIASGRLGPESPPATALTPVLSVFPDMKDAVSPGIPPGAVLFVRVSPKGDGGYKILMSSELCPGVAADNPEKIDAVRTRFGALCLYYGVWNPEGRLL